MDRRAQRELLARLCTDGQRIAARHGLRYRSIQAERANVKRRYGVCFSDGEIRIRLRHARTGEPLKYSSLVNTLCHELAHLRHFHHGERFKSFYLELLAWARFEGIYRPDRPGPNRPNRSGGPVSQGSPGTEPEHGIPQGPEQLGLFG